MSLPATITIVGLGYGDPDSRTVAAQRAIDEADRIVLRTAIHEGIADVAHDARVIACDDIYHTAETFPAIYSAICDRVMEYAESGPVVYAVSGSPTFGELTVRTVCKRATERGLSVAVLPSVSSLDALAAVAGLDLLSDQVQVLDAATLSGSVHAEPFSGGMLGIDPTRPLVIGQVFDQRTASDLKHALARIYPEDHQTAIIGAAGVPGRASVVHSPLCELDHHLVDHLTSVVVPPLAALDAVSSAATLHRVIAHLRSPAGCPWDRKQTHASLKDKIIEEAHEAAEAIEAGDPHNLAEELGDLLLLVALNAQIAEESGTFTIEDIYGHVNQKLVRRHPHVFGDVVAETPEQVLTTWKSVKEQEKPDQTSQESGLRYDQLPKSMSVIQRIRRSEHLKDRSRQAPSEELGDQLLHLVQDALQNGIDPEAALEHAYRRAKLHETKAPATEKERG